MSIRNIIARLLRNYANKIDDGSCELTAEEQTEIMSAISHKKLNKEQASIYLKMSRSRFDDYIRLGIIPKGIKRSGDKFLIWYQDELDECVNELNKKRRVQIGN